MGNGSWGAWIGATVIVALGLAALESFAPEALMPALLLILLSVALTRPGFSQELIAITKGVR